MGQILHGPTLYNPRMLGVGNWRMFDAVVGPTRNVADFTTVNQAIAAGALSIFVKPGTYESFAANVLNLCVVGSGRSTLFSRIAQGATISVTAQNVTLQNFSTYMPPGQGLTGAGVYASGSAEGSRVINVIARNNDYIGLRSDSAEVSFIGCTVEGADEWGFYFGGPRCQAVGCFVGAISGWGVEANGNADNLQLVGNHIRAANSIRLVSGCDNCLVSGNIYDGTLTDSGSGNEVSGNKNY